MVNILEGKQQNALKELAKSGLHQSDWNWIRVFQYLLNFVYTFLLFADITGHFIALPGDETAIEGIMTLVGHIIAVLLAYPLLAVHARGKPKLMWTSLFMLLTGVTDFDGLFGRATLHNDIMHVRAFVYEREELELRHLVSITRMFRKRLENLSLRLYLSLIVFLPMLIMKTYFAVSPEFYTCTLTDATRIGIIFFTFISVIVACTLQEHSQSDYMKAANFQDYFDVCVRDCKFNSTLQTRLTFYLSIVCKVLSFAYRGYSILLYFSLCVLLGIGHLVFITILQWLYHACQRPVYENPTVGMESWWNDLLEIWGRLFFMRGHRLNQRGSDAQMKFWLIWTVTILIQHFAPLYFLTEIYPKTYNPPDSVRSPDYICSYGFYGFLKDILLEAKPGLEFLNNHTTFYATVTRGTVTLTILLSSSFLSHLLTLLYLGAHDQNDDRFPSFVAADIWCKEFLQKDWTCEKYSYQLEKTLVLALIDLETFNTLVTWLGCCPSYKPIMSYEWRALAVVEANKAPAIPDIEFMRHNMLEGNSRREYFEPLVEYIYGSSTGVEATILKRLLYLFIEDFEHNMGQMNSPRIQATLHMIQQKKDKLITSDQSV